MSEAVLLAFVQEVAAQRRAICQAHHHAGTCVGAIGLAEDAAKLLVSLGVEQNDPPSTFGQPCELCGGDEYVIGQIWQQVWVHADCVHTTGEGDG